MSFHKKALKQRASVKNNPFEAGENESKPSRKTILIFLDTDKHASPFGLLVALDLFPDAQILKYSNVAVEDTTRIIQDAMFPRGPGGAKFTKIFIGGQDVEKALEISEIIKKSMFPPFELSIMVDPRGAYSTASAAVAKTLAASVDKGFDDFNAKTVSILAGTGPVGMIAARLYAMEGANVVVTSRRLDRAIAVAKKHKRKTGTRKSSLS